MQIYKYVVLFFLFLPSISFSQEKFDFYISNRGNDSFPGTSNLFPKRSISDVAPLLKSYSSSGKTVKVGLMSGGIWKENLITSYPIDLSTYNADSSYKNFAILDGSKEFSTGWVKQPGTENTFKQAIPYTGFEGYGINGIGNYSFIYVFEIDKQLEKTAPITARKMLKFVADSTLVEHTKGSFYTPPGNENPMPLFIHTSDESSPNGNTKYRYEVCVKDWAVNSTYQENNRFENLWVRGFGAGNGSLPGGANSYYNKIVFGPGAAIHHVGIRSGTIDHSLFLPGPKNTNFFAVVFYDVEGLGRHCTIKNTMFFDISSPVYAHTSEGTNYSAVEIDNSVAFADPTDASGFIYTSNTDSVLLNKVYTDGYYSGYHYGNAKYAAINNCWFKDVNFGIAYNNGYNPIVSQVSDVFIKTKGSSNGIGISLPGQTSVTLTNSIIHIVNKSLNGGSGGAFLTGAGNGGNKVVASGNIFICDIQPSQYLTSAHTDISNGAGTSKDRWNNNVYILLRGNSISWTAVNIDGSQVYIKDLEDWKKQSGQDRNSLFFDLRNDVRGLKAIFTDPDNGNYELANTLEGKQIAALNAGMTDPPTCFLTKPTYEEAADLVRNNKTLSFNNCRNPCDQNTVRVNNTFNLTPINNRQIKLQWNISEQQNIDHYELQRSSLFFGFRRIAFQPVSVDSSYSFIDNVEPGLSYQYRLLVAPKTGGQCYSNTRTFIINNDKPFNIYPNPSTGKILVSMNGYIGNARFSVSSSIGQTVMAVDAFSVYRGLQLDFTNQPKGIYFLNLNTDKGKSVQKFVLY